MYVVLMIYLFDKMIEDFSIEAADNAMDTLVDWG